MALSPRALKHGAEHRVRHAHGRAERDVGEGVQAREGGGAGEHALLAGAPARLLRLEPNQLSSTDVFGSWSNVVSSGVGSQVWGFALGFQFNREASGYVEPS
eukprot:193886-Rhodomonas_salina.3